MPIDIFFTKSADSIPPIEGWSDKIFRVHNTYIIDKEKFICLSRKEWK